MNPYKLKIAAGAEEAYSFGKNRNFILLDESSSVSVTIKSPDNNEQTVLSAGDWAQLSPFEELRFSHDGASDTAFTVYVGKDTMKGSQRVGGNVQITGGSDNFLAPPLVTPANLYSENEKHFTYQDTLVAWPAQSILNPVGSGMIIKLKGIIVFDASSAYPSTLNHGWVGATLSTVASAPSKNNKYYGKAETAAVFKQQAALPIWAGNYQYSILTAETDLLHSRSPMILAEGVEYAIYSGSGMFVTFDYEEM